jgi:hypothetical protein
MLKRSYLPEFFRVSPHSRERQTPAFGGTSCKKTPRPIVAIHPIKILKAS